MMDGKAEQSMPQPGQIPPSPPQDPAASAAPRLVQYEGDTIPVEYAQAHSEDERNVR